MFCADNSLDVSGKNFEVKAKAMPRKPEGVLAVGSRHHLHRFASHGNSERLTSTLCLSLMLISFDPLFTYFNF